MERFEDFYITWYSRAKRFAREYVGEVEAEDVVQDVFIHLYERRDLLDAYTNLTAYLFTAVKNKCLDVLHCQVAEREKMASMQEERDLEIRMSLDSLEALDVRFPDEVSIEERLEQALAALPEKCRMIFVMNKLEGKKQYQIAEELNISVNTVETQMAVAYKKLRQELKDCLPLMAFICSLA